MGKHALYVEVVGKGEGKKVGEQKSRRRREGEKELLSSSADKRTAPNSGQADSSCLSLKVTMQSKAEQIDFQFQTPDSERWPL